jgi:RimJ/RimL family protein N-acetyltransferase
MLLATLLYAVLFALMNAFNAPPIVSGAVAVWVTVVGIAQAVLFGGRKPRVASAATGAVLAAVVTLFGSITFIWIERPPPAEMLAIGIYCVFLGGLMALLGAGFGYLAGCLMAAIFMVSEQTPQDEPPARSVPIRPEVVDELAPAAADSPGMKQPTLETERLILRPFLPLDAAEVRRQAGEFEIASTTLRIPHPYSEAAAERWIASLAGKYLVGEEVNFAVVLKCESRLIGAVGLTLEGEHRRAELGYWIGRDYWNRGYATEAARRVLAYGFAELGLRRVVAHFMSRNPASGRVLEKLGMTREGRLRQHILKWGEWEDIELFGVLKSDGIGAEGT